MELKVRVTYDLEPLEEEPLGGDGAVPMNMLPPVRILYCTVAWTSLVFVPFSLAGTTLSATPCRLIAGQGWCSSCSVSSSCRCWRSRRGRR